MSQHKQEINNGGGSGDYGSGGSMNNPMYRKIACDGHYQRFTGRRKQRHRDRRNGISLSKKKQFWELENSQEAN